MSRAAPRRRGERSTRSARQRRRFDVTVVLALLVPVLTLGAVAVARPGVDDGGTGTPTEVPLPQAVAACPSGAGPVLVASADATSGPVTARLLDGSDAEPEEVPVTGAGAVEVPGTDGGDDGGGPVSVETDGDLAPGLIATRTARPLAAAECGPPVFDQWFTGVGAGAEHASVLEAVNPDAGPALLEVTVLGSRGPLDVDDLRGIRVPGRSAVTVDLADVVPRRSEVALHVVTTRGRATTSVVDRQEALGGGATSTDYLPGQAAPATSSLLLAPPTEGERTLFLANPGDTETRAALSVVTDETTFTPEGLEEVVVPPGSVVATRVDDALDDGALGLRVEADQPLTATLRSLVDDDVALTAPAQPLEAGTTALLPGGATQRLVLGGATGETTVVVRAADTDGEQLAREKVRLDLGRAASVDLPDEATSVSVEPEGGPVQGVVALTGDGTGLVRLRPLERTASVPQVRPGLP